MLTKLVMDKYLKLVIGLLLMVLGLFLTMLWAGSVMTVLKGSIGLFIIFIGLVIFFIAISDLKG